jgi:tellurite resistance protein
MPEPSRWWEFEKFVREILQRTPGIRISDPVDTLFSGRRTKDRGFDVEAMRDGRPLLVEIKYQTPQTSVRLNEMIQQLRAAARRYTSAVGSSARPELLAVFPGVLSASKRESSRHDEVEIWDGRDLQRQARQLGVRVPAFVAASEGEESAEDREPAQELTQRLGDINPGRLDAPAYEKWCEDVLNFLFCPPLNSPIVQHRDDVSANRRDLIMPNYATRGFWHFLRNHYGAAFVVAEAKNSTSPVEKLAVLQLANYLSRHGTGLFGILLTRHGMNASAKWTRREQWVLHDKMIIALDDEDMRQMLLTKLTGKNPATLIQQRIEDFRLRI